MMIVSTFATLIVMLAACQSVTLPIAGPAQPSLAPLGHLAGDWEYEDSGIVQVLRLDRFGNGAYPWKDGRFSTVSLRGQVWRGSWLQRANDREGEFEIVLGPDYSEGEGRWWYTRIEDDTAPARSGGTFSMKRLSASPTTLLEARDAR